VTIVDPTATIQFGFLSSIVFIKRVPVNVKTQSTSKKEPLGLSHAAYFDFDFLTPTVSQGLIQASLFQSFDL
jgi:hypothetical protein